MKKDINCKVLVCCHKKDIHASFPPYMPIQVGKSLSEVELDCQGDDEGENISSKNASYCELTGMYWAWKNLKNVDVVGLCHYRRYFDFHNQCKKVFPYSSFPTGSFDSIDLSIPDDLLDKVVDGSAVVAKPMNYRYNLMIEYCVSHVSDDYRILRQIIKESQSPDIQEAFFQVFYQNNKLMHYNMFIMKWADFDEYCNWLFPILRIVEDRTDITHYNSIQKRIFGYMSERLLNVWLYAKRKKLIHKPVIWFNDNDATLNHYSLFSYKVRCFLNDASMLLLRYKNHNF